MDWETTRASVDISKMLQAAISGVKKGAAVDSTARLLVFVPLEKAPKL